MLGLRASELAVAILGRAAVYHFLSRPFFVPKPAGGTSAGPPLVFCHHVLGSTEPQRSAHDMACPNAAALRI